eukprot:1140281-Pelagomonas_calceolata.AAC.2
MDKGAEHRAQQRTGQAADPKLHTLILSKYKHLQLGRSSTDVSIERPSLGFIKAMKCIKDPKRNKKKKQHLTACAHAH